MKKKEVERLLLCIYDRITSLETLAEDPTDYERQIEMLKQIEKKMEIKENE